MSGGGGRILAQSYLSIALPEDVQQAEERRADPGVDLRIVPRPHVLEAEADDGAGQVERVKRGQEAEDEGELSILAFNSIRNFIFMLPAGN